MLELPDAIRADLLARARRARPREACGLLLGRLEPGGAVVVEAVEARNRAAADDRYALDPEDHLRIELAARARGLAVVAAWHSHPDGDARFSEVDRAEAWEGLIYVVVAPAHDPARDRGGGEVRAWRLRAGALDEVPVEIVRGT